MKRSKLLINLNRKNFQANSLHVDFSPYFYWSNIFTSFYFVILVSLTNSHQSSAWIQTKSILILARTRQTHRRLFSSQLRPPDFLITLIVIMKKTLSMISLSIKESGRRAYAIAAPTAPHVSYSYKKIDALIGGACYSRSLNFYMFFSFAYAWTIILSLINMFEKEKDPLQLKNNCRANFTLSSPLI